MKEIPLRKIWQSVSEFSADARDHHSRASEDGLTWAKEYLLGAYRELASFAVQMPEWRPHRQELNRPVPFDRKALAEEAADVMNYVIAALDVLGITADEFATAWQHKQYVLEQRFQQEILTPIKSHKYVVMIDLDGCVADFRRGILDDFIETYDAVRESSPSPKRSTTLHLDIEFGWSSDWYREAKARWEAGGGYGRLPTFESTRPIMVMLEELRRQFGSELAIAFVTSRPTEPRTVWHDTMRWITYWLGDVPFHLQFTQHKAEWLKATGCEVLFCLEDEPRQATRLAQSGYTVIVPARGYNQGVDAIERSNDEGKIIRVPEHLITTEIRGIALGHS